MTSFRMKKLDESRLMKTKSDLTLEEAMKLYDEAKSRAVKVLTEVKGKEYSYDTRICAATLQGPTCNYVIEVFE